MITLVVLFKFVLSRVLILYYGIKIALIFGFYWITHPFSKPFTPTLRNVPPKVLQEQDGKYGTHGYMKVNNINIHYVSSGDRSKTLMVFVHGYPEFWYSWRHQLAEFSKDYWCVAYDQRGYGDTDKPKDVSAYHLDNMATDLHELVKALGREKFILVSHDWGTVVSWRYRDRYPESVLSFVSLSGTSAEAWGDLIWSEIKQFRSSWYIFFFQNSWLPELSSLFKDCHIFDRAMRLEGCKFVTDEDIECYKFVFSQPGAFTPPLNYYRANFNDSTKLPKLKGDAHPVPCLFILGEKDIYISPKNGEILQQYYKNVQIKTLKNTRHFVQQENPVELNKAIRTFLREQNL